MRLFPSALPQPAAQATPRVPARQKPSCPPGYRPNILIRRSLPAGEKDLPAENGGWVTSCGVVCEEVAASRSLVVSSCGRGERAVPV